MEALARRKFERFKKEKPKAGREFKIERNPFTEEVISLWQRVRDCEGFRTYHGRGIFTTSYTGIASYVSSRVRKFSSEEIHEISKLLPYFEMTEPQFYEIGGRLLSALIMSSQDTDFLLDLSKSSPLRYVTTSSGNRVVIEGDLGNKIADWMQGGELVIKGNVGHYIAGFLQGGKITVEGDAGNFLCTDMDKGEVIVKGDAGDNAGSGMRGGTLHIEGNAGEKLGEKMKGGTIIIQGDYKSLGKPACNPGRIIHRGEQIRG